MRQRHFIDSHKGATGLFTLLMMYCYDAWENPLLWVYLALHGTYGVLWILKSRMFGDMQWEQRTGLPYGLVIWAGLSMYWTSPWLIASGRATMPPAWYLGMCVATFAFGVFFHFASDMQKHMWLKLRPGQLLTEGLWSRLRNPNYLGELLIYAGFSLLARSWIPLAALACFVLFIWVPNMLKKDRSLSRYAEFAEYKAKSWRFIPLVW
jgi:protein-S-isoprenylcysteine O-methyltransferase Ste14